jgi:polyribonucleotide nucleotidyltransferase
LANQADGSVLAKCGNTSVLCVVCSAKEDSPDVDFFPLTVNYIEKAYAAGKIPSGFFKREGKQSEREILISRLIDRPLRPIFVDGYYRNTQIVCTLLSYDKECEPDIVAMVGASAAVAIAGLPTQGIISGCRVGYIDGKYVINPSVSEMKNSALDIVVAGTTDAVLMVESEAKILSEDEMLGAIEAAQKVINSSVEQIKEFVAKVNKKPSVVFVPRDRSKLYEKMCDLVKTQVVEAFKIQDKHERHETLKEIFEGVKEELYCCEFGSCEDECECQKQEEGKKEDEKCYCECCCDDREELFANPLVFQDGEPVEMNDVDIKLMYEKLQEEVVRGQILRDKIRIGGRQLDEVRPLDVRVGVLPVVHGSAVFSRGLTQVMAVATLGDTSDEQQADSITDPKESQRFMLNYNFPGYSAGEATPPKSPGRRELGHGNLARRALNPVIPSKEDFPYTIRVVGEVMSSDGSTSQATVCSSCMALMDVGVPIKDPVAGVAMGLIKEENGYAVLTDIMADEDHLGDMDFKVAGTKDGITALQMDIKTFGITMEIMKDALAQAKKARMFIMSKMMEVLPAPRKELNGNVPKIFNMKISEKQISDVIGKGGATVKKIYEVSGAKIDVQQNGMLTIFANNDESLSTAIEMINYALGKIEFGKIFDATVKSVLSFGAIVDIGYNMSGLVHISELSDTELEPSALVEEGMKVKVKYIGNDEKGRFKFSMKAVDQNTGEDRGFVYIEDENDKQANKKSDSYSNKKNDQRRSEEKKYISKHRHNDRRSFEKKKGISKQKKKFLFF